MMMTYLNEIVNKLFKQSTTLTNVVFILPSKRAGSFLKKEIILQNNKAQFAPEIYSIEEFIEKIADIKIAGTLDLLFEFYEIYLNENSIPEKEDFESFSSWATVLIDDFNEIDRNLLDHNRFFNYLSEIKEIEHWYLNKEKTPLIKNYLSFWNSLPALYLKFSEKLKLKGVAHQGLVYKEAALNIEHYLQAKKNKSHIFIGFNALNKAEEVLIQEMLEYGNTKVYWDAEKYFMEKPYHSASFFLNEIKNKWKYYKDNPFLFISNYFEQHKTINITGCSENIGQVKYVSKILESYSESQLAKTALVLADENLLIPVLNSLPQNINTVNITMGLPLKTIPAVSFFESILKIHKDNTKAYYYKDVLEILNHPLSNLLISKSTKKIKKSLQERNLTQLNFESIESLASIDEHQIIACLFSQENTSVNHLISNAKKIIFYIKEKLNNDPILLQTLYKLNEIWNQLKTLNDSYSHIKSTKTLYQLFNEISALTSIDFKGEPYQGLQIMGLLETRVLDFENVILLSVNEGTLPAGKNNKSFITYDLKKEFNLPTHKEKDAVYAYHFYSLLHRAKTVHLLYNNQSSGLNTGEKSRFIMQLVFESPKTHIVKEFVFAPKIDIPKKILKKIDKTPGDLEKLKNLAKSGFSPSAITTYIRNPIDFYERYILGIKEVEEIEETVAANTLGTIVHNTLETLYKPFINNILSIEILKLLLHNTDNQVAAEFQNTFKEGNIQTGKNKIIFEISKRYVHNYLKKELEDIEQGNEIVVNHLESKLEAELKIPELEFPVKISGKVDRIDRHNNIYRIIDYKTGLVKQTDLNLNDWETLFTDYDKHSKKIQVLTYALMSQNFIDPGNTQAGIISFRNLSEGFLTFNNKDNSSGHTGNMITKETLNQFEWELNKIIIEICNPNIPFTEKEIKQNVF